MKPEYVATIISEYGKFFLSGAIVRSKKPIHWCATCRTALAEAEVEYEDHTTPSIYVKFPLVSPALGLPELAAGGPASLVIWTTTPWTLPANLAIAVHPDLEYAVLEVDGELLVVAAELAEKLLSAWGLKGKEVFRTLGRNLEGAVCHHPWIDRTSQVILADYVTVTAGTGLVHIAPGHGQEDYDSGRRYHLAPYSPVDDDGRFTKEVPEFQGQGVWKANPGIIELLRQRGALLLTEEASHSYPALLALQGAHYLSGHGTVVHLHGEKRPKRKGPQGHRGGDLDTPLGPGAHLSDGGAAPRLVHLPAAGLGCAHRGLSLSGLRPGAPHPGDS